MLFIVLKVGRTVLRGSTTLIAKPLYQVAPGGNAYTALAACLHTTQNAQAKIFEDKENQFAHNVLEKSLKPYQLFRLEKELNSAQISTIELPSFLSTFSINTDSITNDTVFQHFEALCRYCASTETRISEPLFRQFILLYCERCHTFSDEQLLGSLRLIGQLTTEESVRAPNYIELWNSLDAECCQRIERWDSDHLLLVCDAWYSLNVARICEFVWEALRKLGRKVSRMRPEQLVHAMFFCNVLRRPIFEMFDFEVNLARCAEQMSIQELGVLSMGFFKTQTRIRKPELVEHLYRRLLAELDTVEDINLVAILKVLRYSTKLPQADLMAELLDALCGQVDRISLLGCLHIALMGCEFQYCHDSVIELILQRFKREITQTRLKDLERICLVMGLFNYNSSSGIADELCTKILQMLHTKLPEIVQYPRCFANCLHFLSLRGYYDEEMISAVLEKRFIRHAYGSNITLCRPLFNLDGYARINLRSSNYEGHLLADKMRGSMGKLLTQYIPERNSKYKLNATDRILLEIKEATPISLGPTSLKHILPHFDRPDVVLCFDRTLQKPVSLSKECSTDYSGTILTRKELLGDTDKPEIDTVAIVIAGWNSQLRGKDTYTGLFELKLKQLRMLGHKFIVVPWHQWQEQETRADRQQYLKRKLAAIINA